MLFSKTDYTWGWLNAKLDECKITDGYHAKAIHQNKISQCCIRKENLYCSYHVQSIFKF